MSGAGGEEKAIETLKKIALDENKGYTEKKKAIEALAVFREKALSALAEIADKADDITLRERAITLLREIKEGRLGSSLRQ